MRFFLPFLLVTAASASALAQGAGSQAEAQALFEQGRQLMEQSKFAEACPKLEASQKLDPGAGTLLNLASCYEKNGQTASAWVTYTDAATAAQASGHPDWAEKARVKAAALAPHLSKLTIRVASPVPGLEIKRDGKGVASASFDAPIPVDPGAHRVEASAPGKASWSKKIDVKVDGAEEITVPALEDESSAPATEQPTSSRGNGQRALAIVLAGVGAAALGFGVAFGIDASSKRGIVDDPRFCLRAASGPVRCNQHGVDQLGSAATSATLSTVAIAAGAALIVGGGILFFTSPKGAEPPRAALRVTPSAPSSLAGLSLEGAW